MITKIIQRCHSEGIEYDYYTDQYVDFNIDTDPTIIMRYLVDYFKPMMKLRVEVVDTGTDYMYRLFILK